MFHGAIGIFANYFTEKNKNNKKYIIYGIINAFNGPILSKRLIFFNTVQDAI